MGTRLLATWSTTSTAGGRGRRDLHAEALLRRLTGAEAALVVNNNAAAAAVLAALGRGREVIVSRGELVEIGGGFRVPDVMAQSGALLREVGTTNRTRLFRLRGRDHRPHGPLLRVHPSNFRIEGFTERADAASSWRSDAAGLPSPRTWAAAPARDGARLRGARVEPLVSRQSSAARVRRGLLQRRQAARRAAGGLVIGRREPLEHIRRHPLMRAFRVDKMT